MSVTSGERQSTRFEIGNLIYVELPEERAFMLNVSDGGMAIQAMNILQPGSFVKFAVLPPGGAEQIEGSGKIVWSDKSGRAGVQFTRPVGLRYLATA